MNARDEASVDTTPAAVPGHSPSSPLDELGALPGHGLRPTPDERTQEAITQFNLDEEAFTPPHRLSSSPRSTSPVPPSSSPLPLFLPESSPPPSCPPRSSPSPPPRTTISPQPNRTFPAPEATSFPLVRDVDVYDNAMHLINTTPHPSTTVYRLDYPGLNRVDLKRDSLSRLVSESRWLNGPVLDGLSIYLNAKHGPAQKTFVAETMFFTGLVDVGYNTGKLWNCFKVSLRI